MLASLFDLARFSGSGFLSGSKSVDRQEPGACLMELLETRDVPSVSPLPASVLHAAQPALVHALKSAVSQSVTTQTTETFQEPTILRSRNGQLNVTLVAQRSKVTVNGQLVSGMMTYNGTFPGPTLMLKPGDTLHVHLVNHLKESTNLHFHGLHVSPTGHADNIFVDVEPGDSFDYTIQIPNDHPTGIFWYHTHDHMNLEEQLYKGLSGMLIIQDPTPLPSQLAHLKQRDISLKQFRFSNGVLDDFDVTSPDSIFTLNGQVNPTITIKPGETQIWNIANVNNEGFWRLHIEGQPFYVIGQDGHPLDRVRVTNDLVVGPAMRYSVLVQGVREGTSHFVMEPYASGPDPDLMYPAATLATVVTEGKKQKRLNLNQMNVQNRGFEDLRNESVAKRRVMKLGMGTNPATGGDAFTMNGYIFPATPDVVAQLNSVEEWTIVNVTEEIHPFHLHTNPFEVVAVNGRGVNNSFDQDTVSVLPGESVTIRIKFTDFVGASLYHCHIAEHEMGGMAGRIIVDRFSSNDTFAVRPS